MEATVVQRFDGAIAVITLNRPAIRNAIDIATMRLLGEEVSKAIAHDVVRVIVITGAGDKAFSAGGDMGEMAHFTALGTDTLMKVWQNTLEIIERSPKPVIAAINGFALGGGTELAMACHIRVAAERAILGQPEIALDHLPGAGGTQRLPRLIPLGLAYEYLLTGDMIPAAEAHRIGLVNHVWPDAQFMSNAIAFAGRIAARSPVAVRYSLEAIRDGLRGSLDTGLRLERAMAGLVLESDEARTGIEKFLAKRNAKKG